MRLLQRIFAPDDVVTVRPTHVHGCHHPPSLHCHTMPWERLINICITVIILIPLRTTLALQYAMSSALPGNCLQWLETLEEGGLLARLFRSAAVAIRRFSNVQQFPRLTTISYPASICVSCHHNGLQGLMLWAHCQLFLGCRETSPSKRRHEPMEI